MLSFALPPSHLGHWLRLPPSRLGHSSKLDGSRLGVGSSKLDGSRFGVGSSKLDSAFVFSRFFLVVLLGPKAVCGFRKGMVMLA